VVISLVDTSMRKATRQLQQQIGVAEVIETADPRRLAADDSGGPAPAATPPSTIRRDATDSGTPDSATPRGATIGTIKFFSPARGYGFIARPGADDLFVHHTNIAVRGAKSTKLTEGQQVRYTIGTGRRGPEAFAVTPA
jgi:CspA family cold shock protein